jgi:hypothetical protein
MRKLTINTEGGQKLIGMVSGSEVTASLTHKESKVVFTIHLFKNDIGSTNLEPIFRRSSSGGKAFPLLAQFYFKKYSITEKSSKSDISNVINIFYMDITSDFDEIISKII